ncbi:MAG: aminoacyl-tRNA hydrolase [Candidatus Paceibacterota bacterium]
MHYIVGLGNKGEKYAFTRHNAGFMVLEVLRNDWGFEDWSFQKNISSFTSKGELNSDPVTLVMPDTFMNLSGRVIRKLKKEGMDVERFALVHDDLDLPLGTLKFVVGKGPGGHKGVSSVIEHLGTKNFLRLRFGIAPVSEDGEPRKPQRATDSFVLERFTEEEMKAVHQVAVRGREYLRTFVTEGVEKAISSCKG